tara:strand:+ start:868 stop:1089 length:222 start_codon:yes stop_codon:yes gene_type:complete
LNSYNYVSFSDFVKKRFYKKSAVLSIIGLSYALILKGSTPKKNSTYDRVKDQINFEAKVNSKMFLMEVPLEIN